MRVFGRAAFSCCRSFVIFFLIATGVSILGQPSRAQDPQPATGCSVDSEAPKRYALLVGINEYAESVEDEDYTPRTLQGPENDLIKIRQLLVNTYCFLDDEEHIVVLTSEQATEEAIATQFRTHLVGNAEQNPNGTFLFYFAGHGSQAGDNDEDEGDGWDETILAYNSRTTGKVGIIDDEIASWIGELTQAASGPDASVTLIFDSCHSGSVTRDPDTSLVARMEEPTASQRAIAEQLPAARGAELSGFLPSGDNYTVLSASLPEEVAYEDEIEALNDGQRYGLFSYYLTEVLSRSPGITFKEAEQEVTQLILQHANQHAVAEGDVDRPVFGAAGDREEPFITIRSVDEDEITIEAGRIHGLQNGAILAIYDPASTTLTGEDMKLATASVTRAGNQTSVATFLESPDAPLPDGAKVKIVSPYSAEERLPVDLGTPPFAADTAFDRAVRQRLGQLLSDENSSRLARVRAEDEGAADEDEHLLLTAGCYSTDRLPIELPADQQILLRQRVELAFLGEEPCRRAYYLTAPGSAEPLFEFFTTSTDPDVVAAQLMDVINKRAKQLNLLGLANQLAPDTHQVSLSLVKLDLLINGQEFEVLSQTVMEEDESATVALGDYFNFRITNEAPEDLYVALLQIGTDGSITLLNENRRGDRVQSGQTIFTRFPIMAGPPVGVDTYKVIATTNPNLYFDVLEQPGVARRDVNPPSALELLLANSVDEESRTALIGQELRLDNWTTTQIDVRVIERQD